jgi:16S rRNA (guanine527-N7)-methyltransferase
MSKVDIFKDGAKELKIDISEEELKQFSVYKDLLKEWNEKINITAITDDDEIDIKHFLDSISVLMDGTVKGNEKIIDIGTGGGFPGIPIKILKPDTQVVLLDGLNKRLKFLNEVIETLKLDDIETVHGRAEELGRKKEYREQFDIAVSRAVASLNTLSEYCLPFVKVGGYFIAMKGPEVDDEIIEAKKAIEKLGGEIEKRVDIELPFSDITHNLLFIKKTKETPKVYPRGAGNPKKKPL